MKKTICSFINSFGGRIFIGIQDKNLKVSGIQLFSYQIDRLKNIIHNLTRQFKPRVDDEVQIKIIPIKDFKNQLHIEGKYVIKVLVKPG